ncbi:uncharacterized protein PADG_03473 [Paracoccidioides brasiliensis Pb18]|uniref:alpha-glucosidase n=1 Tax=Paracoccidioides brasiliensis (strain Pb18) TaxID=502780 RepID=C1G5A3_PARBD|nr:uncharacterized protein PADG_03473 [Paracoccidioides brasiliensis Pb18]EEH47375.2 hypothetical protein PADG_03473 [Paracoccidioides brasiliensis Pb18]
MRSPGNPLDAYKTYKRGNTFDVFVWNPYGSVHIRPAWPGYTVLPDFQLPVRKNGGQPELREFFDKVPLDGNLALHPVHPPFPLPGEPGNVSYYYPEDFDITNATETASASIAYLRQGASKTSKNSSLTTTMSHEYLRTTPTPGFRNINHPPYVTNHVPGDLAVHAESPDATHSDGVVEYDIHNLYRHHLLNVTYHGLRCFRAIVHVLSADRPSQGAGQGIGGSDSQSRRTSTFILCLKHCRFRSTESRYSASMRAGSAATAMRNFCNRWMRLSAFFPFYINHNVLLAIPQEPYI